MPTWLVLEDEPSLHEMLLAMTHVLGAEGLAFINGEDALAWIETVDTGQFSGELPELALVDIRMPGAVSGLEVSARLRYSHALSRIPIVLLTAYHMSAADEQTAIEQSGADALVYKPLPKFDEFRDLLRGLLSA
ncbi:MAG: response regulator [Chloroflexi bacterium]|nr:response regulator [Chloroflexota bacterium]